MKLAGGPSGRRNYLPSGWPTAEFISSPAEKHARLPRRFLLNSRVNKSERQARLCLFAPGLRHHYRGYRKVSEARFEQGEASVREEQKQSDRAGSGAGARRGKARVARHVAGPGGADPEAATKFPADGPRADGHLHAASEHPRFLPLRSGSRAAADPSADGPTVDGTDQRSSRPSGR